MLRYSAIRQGLTLVFALIVMMSVAATAAFGQEGEFNLADDDGRLNIGVHMGGLAVYCVDATNTTAISYVGGGFRVLDDRGEEMLFVPEATITAAFDTLAQTGQFVTLGTSERAWYGGGPVAIYLLTSGEFQINAADEYDKPVVMQWRECRTFTVDTIDGCRPAWDRDSNGHCVNLNLY